jgi:hypothetical protein
VSLGADGTLRFTTTQPIPPGGSVLVATEGIELTGVGASEGFGAGATVRLEPGALTDATAQGVARPAVVVRLPQGAPPGPKAIALQLGPAAGAASVVVQTLDTVDTLEQAKVDIA